MRDLNAIVADVDAHHPVRRAEAEQVVRAVPKQCRGPLDTLHPKAVRTLMRAVAHEPAAAAAATAAVEAGADARGVINAVGAAGFIPEAGRVNDALRVGCGRDFNDLILAAPLDGEEHDYTCPSCGVGGTYRAPYILESPAEG